LEGIEDLRTGRTTLSDAAQSIIEDYRDVQNVFTNFANSMQNGGRGDTFYISDVPRGILIKGKNTKVTDLFGTTIENNAYDFGDKVNHSFSTSIYYPIKHTFDTIVSSYMSTYAQWVKISDVYSGEKFWLPVSGYVAGNMAATDGTYGPWYAAAGLRRGVIKGVLDYALSPSVTQRTDLYKLCINSVPKIPNYGVTIWGLRTMSKAASAFDQNTCRRTFLYMEKKVKQTLRYYIFEPNTSYTRLNIVNDIDPFLEKVKNAGGIYSYTLVCDNTNNTPDVINNGDLAVSIAAAPTRTAENIVVEFTANKYTEEVSASESIS
jgi:phage tail sheath protein FI